MTDQQRQNSILRKNQSGCCCTIDDDNNIVQLCGAHEEHYEDYLRSKGWISPEQAADNKIGKILDIYNYLSETSIKDLIVREFNREERPLKLKEGFERLPKMVKALRTMCEDCCRTRPNCDGCVIAEALELDGGTIEVVEAKK